MKYRITLNGKTYEVEVEREQAIMLAEYQACDPSSDNVSGEAIEHKR